MLTLEDGSRLLALYDAMALAARDNDWDRLAALGADAETLRKAAAAGTSDASRLTPQEQQLLAATIQRILEVDRQIREHAEPALESARKLLSSTVRDQNVRNAYGST